LIHHFVGVIIGVVDTGVVVVPPAYTVSLRSVALPNNRKGRQEKRMTKLEIVSIFWLRGSLSAIGRIAKKIGDEVFHDSCSKSQVIRIPLLVGYQHSYIFPLCAFLDGNEKIYLQLTVI